VLLQDWLLLISKKRPELKTKIFIFTVRISTYLFEDKWKGKIYRKMGLFRKRSLNAGKHSKGRPINNFKTKQLNAAGVIIDRLES
jgi:hypothetical protein